jgi:hypothetical protein
VEETMTDSYDKKKIADDLRQAAQRVRWAGQRATNGPWHPLPNDLVGGWALAEVHTDTLTNGVRSIGDFTSEQDARWAAKMAPHISVPLAELFEEAAGWVEAWDDDILPPPLLRYVAPLAWAVLRTGQTWP